MNRSIRIQSHQSIDGLHFGMTLRDLIEQLGEPDQTAQNYTGEFELAYDDRIYRCLAGRLVECTFPDRGRFSVDGVEILSVFDWLAGLPNTVDLVKFRISLEHGIAYDYRDPDHGSITVFEHGRWDDLVASAR